MTEALDLFGLAGGPMLTPQQRRKLGNKRATQPKGYVALPGTGPKGETCGTCTHKVSMRKYRKCELNRPRWTHGPGTDILARSPACSKWEAKAP